MYNMHFNNFLKDLDSGFNPELKPVGLLVIDLSDKLYKLRASGMYSSEHIGNTVKEYQEQVKHTRDRIYSDKVKKFEEQLLKIKQRFEKELSDSEVNKKLLFFKQFENKLKVLSTDELNTYIEDLQNNKSTLDVDQLNMLAVEFKSRNEENRFYQLVRIMKDRNVDEPWLNDTEYISISHELSSLKNRIGSRYITVDTTVQTTPNLNMNVGGTLYMIDDLVG